VKILPLLLLTCCATAASDPTWARTTLGVDMRWDRSALPIFVVPSPQLAEWMPALREAVGEINLAVAFTAYVLLPPARIPIDELRMDGTGPLLILPYDKNQTTWWADPASGQMRAALIGLSDAATTEEQRVAVALHELLHALGLDHDEDPSSIMQPVLHPSALTGLVLSVEDVRALQEAYR